MSKTRKIMAMNVNIAFSVSYIYFITFYFMRFLSKIPAAIKFLPEVFIETLSKVLSFLFQSESGMIPLAAFSICLIAVAIFGFSLYYIHFSKVTTVLLCLGFIPALAPILCNAFFGPMTDETSSDKLWFSITVLLLIYFIAFQIFFYRDYKRIKD